MRNFASILCCFLLFHTLSAQKLTGEYAITGQGGTITLQLSENGNGLQGSLTDMQGVVYQVQGTVEDGDAFGTMSTPQGAMYFEAFREDQDLYLTLIPAGTDGQPDVSGAQEFVLTATGRAVPAPVNPTPPSAPPREGTIGGPLSGAEPGPAANWNGTFNGNIMGTATTMNLQLDGSRLNGTVDAGGYRYNLQGTTNGNRSQGKFSDPQTQGFFDYTAVLNGQQLDLTLQNPTNGQSQQIVFTRSSAGSISPGNNPAQPNAAPPASRDSRLVGSWNYTDSYTSGEYSFATQWKLIINPDGSYIYGDGRVIGGGGGISGDSGSGGDVVRGQWKTENGIIHINTGAGWQAYARYTTNGQSMLMQFGDGSKQLWKRSY
ncbi:hypothetical protein [Flavilitoribacter nigricans]|uniref:Uncharacterized protein n=1 Tax=Flavilitoribacter nigricans (strain ATCC 23147 / DSM 23189 / NBRC 102662 / NCIMB 1420 / SS-2) TaxID=1122177 RepID=A0A2D0MZV9_FLAN2|nr:hypothetical protein [Flavilitoribacter nigricans]PHN01656.1 hypothetical protein CRP01_36170 [Flavilitoribacter nigricans DSM 23189 = NBRC 102662]